jgi:hypothetical protein
MTNEKKRILQTQKIPTTRGLPLAFLWIISLAGKIEMNHLISCHFQILNDNVIYAINHVIK